MRVLLIDDELDLVHILTLNLNLLGYTCQTCTSTIDAREFLVRDKFDFVICDVIMPGETGLDFFKSLKAQSLELPPFIFYTGLCDFSIRAPFPEGILGFIQKPFSIDSFIKQLPVNLRPGGLSDSSKVS